jgi:hypothetical protein
MEFVWFIILGRPASEARAAGIVCSIHRSRNIYRLIVVYCEHILDVTYVKNGKVFVGGQSDEKTVNMRKQSVSFPVKFGTISGNFDCSNTVLHTLSGGPVEVAGHFICNKINIDTLVGGPNRVGDNYECYANLLTTLQGLPEYVGYRMLLSWNENLPVLRLVTLKYNRSRVAGGVYFNRSFGDWQGHDYEVSEIINRYNTSDTSGLPPKQMPKGINCKWL